MTISATAIKELRELTGSGMMDCKRALEEAKGDMQAAIEILRTTGLAKAVKKASRTAAEGIISIGTHAVKAVMLEINSETDFVARDEHFVSFAKAVTEAALHHETVTLDALMAIRLSENNQTIEEARSALVAKVGENISLRRIAFMKSAHNLGHYLHGTKIGVLVELQGGDEALAKDICMHIAASRPEVIEAQEVSKERLEQERRIAEAQAKESGKPQNIIEKMVEGRLKKFVNEISLLGQAYVKEPDMTVEQFLKGKATVLRFVRFEVGEGIEKQTANFVEEVMAQVQGG